MNQVSERGVCDINENNEDQTKIDSPIECSDGIHVSMQSIVKLYAAAVKQGSEPLKKDNKVVEEETTTTSIITYQKRKRLKMTQIPTNDLEITKEDAASSSSHYRVGTTSFDQPIEIESATHCSETMTHKTVTAQNTVAPTNNLLEADSDCVLGFHATSSNYDDKAYSNENCDAADMLAVTLPQMENDEATISRNSFHANNFLEQENISNNDEDSLQQHEEQSVAFDATDISSKQFDGSKGVSALVVNECGNVAVDRPFSGFTGKKLLVLDVNGLLVDISAYVPYDYDPDDIIMRKAVFKRPYCDDFLKFCFDKFNVGVWTSRTKRNVEPILDFLLGNDKCKLLFCWDQSHCTQTGFTTVEKRYKPLLLKKLKKLWDKVEPDLPWERGVYNESNTLLLDDTPSKALSNPIYNAVFPYTYWFRKKRDNSLGPGGDLRVYLEGLAMAENVQEYVKQNPFGQRPITEKNLSWGFYLRVIEASSTPPRQTEQNDS